MSKLESEFTGARELSDAELMQVQGGGLLGDAWNWVKDKVGDAADAVSDAFKNPVGTLNKLVGVVDWIRRHYPAPHY